MCRFALPPCTASWTIPWGVPLVRFGSGIVSAEFTEEPSSVRWWGFLESDTLALLVRTWQLSDSWQADATATPLLTDCCCWHCCYWVQCVHYYGWLVRMLQLSLRHLWFRSDMCQSMGIELQVCFVGALASCVNCWELMGTSWISCYMLRTKMMFHLKWNRERINTS